MGIPLNTLTLSFPLFFPYLFCLCHLPTTDSKPFSGQEYLVPVSLKEWQLLSSALSGSSSPFWRRLKWEPCSLNPHSPWIELVMCMGPSCLDNLSSLNNSEVPRTCCHSFMLGRFCPCSGFFRGLQENRSGFFNPIDSQELNLLLGPLMLECRTAQGSHFSLQAKPP